MRRMYLSGCGTLEFSINDLVLPVTVNYCWQTAQGNGIEIFGGIGAATVGLWGNTYNEVHFNGQTDDGASLTFNTERDIEAFAIIGAQLYVPCGKIALKPFISYSRGFTSNAYYQLSPMQTGGTLTKDITSAPITMNDLECGIILQF